jgi:hypothetical protein
VSYRCSQCGVHVDGPMLRHVVTRDVPPQATVVRGMPVYGKARTEIVTELPVCGRCLRALQCEAVTVTVLRKKPDAVEIEPDYQQPKFGD